VKEEVSAGGGRRGYLERGQLMEVVSVGEMRTLVY
jgi:hypothetical protein